MIWPYIEPSWTITSPYSTIKHWSISMATKERIHGGLGDGAAEAGHAEAAVGHILSATGWWG